MHTIVFDFKSEGAGFGKGGTGTLTVDGKEVANNSLEHTTPVTFPEDETFDVGKDTRTGVPIGVPLRLPFQVHRQDQQADLQTRTGEGHGTQALATSSDCQTGSRARKTRFNLHSGFPSH